MLEIYSYKAISFSHESKTHVCNFSNDGGDNELFHCPTQSVENPRTTPPLPHSSSISSQSMLISTQEVNPLPCRILHNYLLHLCFAQTNSRLVMITVTPLNISLNFSQVRSAKDPSLANLPSQRLEKQNKTQKEQSNKDTRVTRILSQLVLITLTRQNCFLNQSTMLSPKHTRRNPFSQNSLSLFQGCRSPFKRLKLQLQI